MFQKPGMITLLNLGLVSLSSAKPEEKTQRAERLFHHLQNAFKGKTTKKDLAFFMENISEECKRNRTIIPHLEKTIFFMHDTLKGKTKSFMKDFVDAKLIASFCCATPVSLEHKKKLLNAMKDMRYLTSAHQSASIILCNMSKDYVRNKQYMKDPNFSYVPLLAEVIEKMTDGQNWHTIATNADRSSLREALSTLKKFVPLATIPLIKKLSKKIKAIPAKRRIGKSELWKRTAFGEAPDANCIPKFLKGSSYIY